mmetsp:Transcript_15378/g.43646  ORF Transcript_15378/g.43646 Transcript_15378/m.43646 type:complete len:286 (-) Transcript_15378:571-1428(-)
MSQALELGFREHDIAPGEAHDTVPSPGFGEARQRPVFGNQRNHPRAPVRSDFVSAFQGECVENVKEAWRFGCTTNMQLHCLHPEQCSSPRGSPQTIEDQLGFVNNSDSDAFGQRRQLDRASDVCCVVRTQALLTGSQCAPQARFTHPLIHFGGQKSQWAHVNAGRRSKQPSCRNMCLAAVCGPEVHKPLSVQLPRPGIPSVRLPKVGKVLRSSECGQRPTVDLFNIALYNDEKRFNNLCNLAPPEAGSAQDGWGGRQKQRCAQGGCLRRAFVQVCNKMLKRTPMF